MRNYKKEHEWQKEKYDQIRANINRSRNTHITKNNNGKIMAKQKRN